jgi:hypothetical protein
MMAHLGQGYKIFCIKILSELKKEKFRNKFCLEKNKIKIFKKIYI